MQGCLTACSNDTIPVFIPEKWWEQKIIRCLKWLELCRAGRKSVRPVRRWNTSRQRSAHRVEQKKLLHRSAARGRASCKNMSAEVRARCRDIFKHPPGYPSVKIHEAKSRRKSGLRKKSARRARLTSVLTRTTSQQSSRYSARRQKQPHRREAMYHGLYHSTQKIQLWSKLFFLTTSLNITHYILS